METRCCAIVYMSKRDDRSTDAFMKIYYARKAFTAGNGRAGSENRKRKGCGI